MTGFFYQTTNYDFKRKPPFVGRQQRDLVPYAPIGERLLLIIIVRPLYTMAFCLSNIIPNKQKALENQDFLEDFS
jgi:hypothetical protein